MDRLIRAELRAANGGAAAPGGNGGGPAAAGDAAPSAGSPTGGASGGAAAQAAGGKSDQPPTGASGVMSDGGSAVAGDASGGESGFAGDAARGFNFPDSSDDYLFYSSGYFVYAVEADSTVANHEVLAHAWSVNASAISNLLPRRMEMPSHAKLPRVGQSAGNAPGPPKMLAAAA